MAKVAAGSNPKRPGQQVLLVDPKRRRQQDLTNWTDVLSRRRTGDAPRRGGAMELSQCGRFAVPAVLLVLTLADGPKSGASIAADLSRVTDRRLRAGTLYGTIARLEQAGLIEPCTDLAEDEHRSYRLTAAGHAAAQQQIARLIEGSGRPINSRYPRVRNVGKAAP